jgi:hypothetical protein
MIKNIIQRLFSARPTLLGRWCLRDKSKIHWKIDMANMDHCGTCANDKTQSADTDRSVEVLTKNLIQTSRKME